MINNCRGEERETVRIHLHRFSIINEESKHTWHSETSLKNKCYANLIWFESKQASLEEECGIPMSLSVLRDECSLTKYLEKKKQLKLIHLWKHEPLQISWDRVFNKRSVFADRFQAAHLRLANLWEMRRWARQCIFWRFKWLVLFALFIKGFRHVITQALLVQSRQEKPAWFRPRH